MRIRRLLGLALSLSLAAGGLALALPNGAAGGNAGYDINKDLTNRGPVADDLAIVLAGAETISDHFDGYPASASAGHPIGWFDPPSETAVGGNTVVHWQDFGDLDDSRIDNGQTIHVGLSTADGTNTIADMYWTGPDGKRLPGSVVFDVHAGLTYQSTRATWSWANNFATAAPLSVSNVRYAVFAQPLALGDLVNSNPHLAAALQPLAADFTLAPDTVQSIPLPVAVAAGSAVVVVYQVDAPGSGATVIDFVQTIAK